MNRTVEKDREFGYPLSFSISTGNEDAKEILEKRVVGVLSMIE